MTLGIAFLVASLLAVGAARAYLVENQVRLARVETELSSAASRQHELELRVAELDKPSRIISSAEKDGMVQPSKVQDLPEVPLGYAGSQTLAGGVSRGSDPSHKALSRGSKKGEGSKG